MEEYPCHFQVIYCDGAAWIGSGDQVGADVCWPFETPNPWLDGLCSAEPHPSNSSFASVNVADECWFAWRELEDVCWSCAYLFNHRVPIR